LYRLIALYKFKGSKPLVFANIRSNCSLLIIIMRLVSDYSKFHINVNGVEVVVSPASLPPFDVSAVVEEQDVALILGEPKEVPKTVDKPSWYLSRKLESQVLQVPGSVIIRYEVPLRLQAIVHDFDYDPSWKKEWIAQSLINIFKIANDKEITSLRLPVLGAQYGHFEQDGFIRLLITALNDMPNRKLKRIWLVILPEECEKVFESITALI